MSNNTLILLIIGLPALLIVILSILFKNERFITKHTKIIEVGIFGKQLTLKRYDIIIILFIIAIYSWLNIFAPLTLIIPVVLVALSSFRILKTNTVDPSVIPETTRLLIEKLSSIETDIDLVKQHMSTLQIHLTETQSEVDRKQILKADLETQIQQNQENARAWETMSQQQRNLVSEAAVGAISKKMKWDFWYGIFLGFFINILAALAWALLGDPNKDDIVNKLQDFLQSITHK